MNIPFSHRPRGILPGPSSMKAPISLFMAVLLSCSVAFSQSQSQSSPQSSQSQPPQQSAPQKKDDSSADAGAAKKPDKEKPKPKRVYTEEDLSGMRGNGISVVGDSAPAASGTGAATRGANTKGDAAGSSVVPMSGQDEAYWRGKAKQLLDEIAATDQQIEKTKADIKKYGADGFDATSGYKDNIVYIDNRNSRLEQLQKHKADLEKKLDQLQEDARKAGAAPEWVR